MQTRWNSSMMLLGAALGLAGCDLGTSGPNALDVVNFDAAVVAADAALEDLEMMHGPRLGLSGGVFPGLTGGRPDCPKTQDVFLCDPIERDGITYARTIVYLDAAGNPQDAYDEATTASIEYEISVQGDRSREGWSASFDRNRALVVTGLLDGTGAVLWNGTEAGVVSRSRHFDDGTERSYDMESNGQLTDVAIPLPREDDSWPLSGTISRSLTITRTNGDEIDTIEREVLIEFNGTSQVPVTVGDDTFILDLSQRMRGGRHMRRRPGS